MDNHRRRNGSKRNSGIFDLQPAVAAAAPASSTAAAAPLQRRPSKKAANSTDRHGQVYPDSFADMSIRAVMPDPPPPPPPRAVPDRVLSPRPRILPSIVASPKPKPKPTESSMTGQYGDRNPDVRDTQSSSSSNQVNNSSSQVSSSSNSSNVLSNAVTDVPPRPRTRTMSDRIRERSPSGVLTKSRNRMGSLHNVATFSSPAPTDPMSSIGFPSVTQPAVASNTTRRLVKSPPRPLSPLADNQASIRPLPQLSPSTDTGKILQLMKTTCGRMHGILSFRTSKQVAWSSGYCAINVATGSLIYQMKGDVSHAKTLIPDLRGCKVRTQTDRETRVSFLELNTRTSGLGIDLCPHVPETFDSWLAALLCWQPLRPKGAQNKMAKPQSTTLSERRAGDRRSNASLPAKNVAAIKVGKMLFWDHGARTELPRTPDRRISTYKQQRSAAGTPWRKVSCTLQENGQLKLSLESDHSFITSLSLSALSRCAVQRLHPSVLDDEYCLAIYPQYTTSPGPAELARPLYLSLESRILFEVWFVLLRAFTVPELYGPEHSAPQSPVDATHSSAGSQARVMTDMFRVERCLSLRITEAKLHAPRESRDPMTGPQPHSGSSHGHDWVAGDYHAEVHLDGEVRGRTAIKQDTSNPFWREDYEFNELPSVLSSATVLLNSRHAGQKDWTLIADEHHNYDEHGEVDNLGVVGDIQISPLDTLYGVVDLRLDDVERGKDTEQWWPVHNERDQVVGDVLMKVRIDEVVVLMSRDYEALTELLHSFSNGLTQQIVEACSAEMRRLPEVLLNIFQVSGNAAPWMMSLVEDEIDSVHKETPVSRFRYSRRIASNDTHDAGVERELLLRDLGKNATLEANLLFRGNSLLTKALDLHMRRLGKEYLEDTLSETMRDIDESDPECEVDPNKVRQPEDLQRNWRNLNVLTENVWTCIAMSARRCPSELRVIFRRIRACAEDRYGDFQRSVSYSSVSGFLFLRFFCPAVLNPKLFGLLKDHPRARAQRTLTLIAKSLQTLANLTTFGNKELWMEPMNAFLTSHRQEFKDFVDVICDISHDRATSAVPPSYQAPITMLSRLPAPSREGFPSLPYLLDQSREFAILVNIWHDCREDVPPPEAGQEIAHFDALCMALRARTRDCLASAEQAERPSGTLEVKWAELVEQMDRKASLHIAADSSIGPPPLPTRTLTAPAASASFASPGPAPTLRRMTGSSVARTLNSSTASLTETAQAESSSSSATLNTANNATSPLSSNFGQPASPSTSTHTTAFGASRLPPKPRLADLSAPSEAVQVPPREASLMQHPRTPTSPIKMDPSSSARPLEQGPPWPTQRSASLNNDMPGPGAIDKDDLEDEDDGSSQQGFPLHALHWDDEADAPVQEQRHEEGDDDDDDDAVNVRRALAGHRAGGYPPEEASYNSGGASIGSSVRSLHSTAEASTPAANTTGSTTNTTTTTTMMTPMATGSDLATGRRLVDVWGLRKKNAAAGSGGGSGGSGGSSGVVGRKRPPRRD